MPGALRGSRRPGGTSLPAQPDLAAVVRLGAGDSPAEGGDARR